MDTLQAVAAPAEVVPLAPNRLLALAAGVSQNAALSSRLEDNALVDPPRLSSPGVGRQRAPEPWVVVKDQCHQRKTAALIYRNLPKPRPPVDIVVVWPEDLRRHKDSYWLVIAPALREGRTVCESASGA